MAGDCRRRGAHYWPCPAFFASSSLASLGHLTIWGYVVLCPITAYTQCGGDGCGGVAVSCEARLPAGSRDRAFMVTRGLL